MFVVSTEPPSEPDKNDFIYAVVIGVSVLVLVLVVASFIIIRRRKRRKSRQSFFYFIRPVKFWGKGSSLQIWIGYHF